MILVLLACGLMTIVFASEAKTLAEQGDRITAGASWIISAGFACLGVASCL